MKTAAVSELKASLSEYLRGLKSGEEVIITDRGNPIARLVPINRNKEGIPARLVALEKAGIAKIGSGILPEDIKMRRKVLDKNGSALKALLQEREQGR